MDKMRWFIIGNLIGFGVLIVGIGFNESLKRHAESSASSNATTEENSQRVTHGVDPSRTEPVLTAVHSISDPKAATSSQGSEKSGDLVNEKVKTTKILAATRDISKGTILHAGDVEIRMVDTKLASRDGFISCEDALGQKTKIDLVEGEMLQPSDLEAH